MKHLNLIPSKYHQAKLQRRNRQLIISGAVFLMVIVLGVSFYLIHTKRGLEKEKLAWDSKLSVSSSYLAVGQQFDYIKGLCRQREQTARGLETRGLDVNGLMSHIERSAPASLGITKLTITGGKDGQLQVNMNGVLPRDDELVTFLHRLERDAYFDAIRLSSVKRADSPDGSTLFIFVTNLTINAGK